MQDFNSRECSPREFQIRLFTSQLVQASQFQVGSWDSNTCKQTVLLCDPKFRCHTLRETHTEVPNLWFTKVKWGLQFYCPHMSMFYPFSSQLLFDMGFHTYNPKKLLSSLMAYETVLNAAYLDEIVIL